MDRSPFRMITTLFIWSAFAGMVIAPAAITGDTFDFIELAVLATAAAFGTFAVWSNAAGERDAPV
jgi:hypothetical protein